MTLYQYIDQGRLWHLSLVACQRNIISSVIQTYLLFSDQSLTLICMGLLSVRVLYWTFLWNNSLSIEITCLISPSNQFGSLWRIQTQKTNERIELSWRFQQWPRSRNIFTLEVEDDHSRNCSSFVVIYWYILISFSCFMFYFCLV